MRVHLAYGERGPDIDVPAMATVIEPVQHEAAPDRVAVLRAALRHPVSGPPLRERARAGKTVAISACDGTRPQPGHLIVPAILAELDGVVSPGDVVILVATGTHRGNTDAELRQMFGDETRSCARRRRCGSSGPGARRGGHDRRGDPGHPRALPRVVRGLRHSHGDDALAFLAANTACKAGDWLSAWSPRCGPQLYA